MGITERKERERASRIGEILKAARGLFVNQGYSNTTMLDIAVKSELSRRTIYHYFTSKEEISYKLMLEAYETLKGIIRTSLEASHNTGYEKLVTLQNAFLNFYQEEYDLFSFTLFLDHTLNMTELPSEDAKKSLMIIDSIFTDIEEIYNEGLSDGSIRNTGIGKREFSVTLLTMIQATLQKIYVRKNWMKSNNDLEDQQIIQTMFTLFLSAVKP